MNGIHRVAITTTDSVINSDDGQQPWIWAVPMVHRAASAISAGPLTMPENPNNVAETRNRFDHQLGYYAALQSLLTYSLGWTRPDKGLLWWYQNNRPLADRRFELLASVWDADGHLLKFLAWLESRSGKGMAGATLDPWAALVDRSPLMLDAEWEARLRMLQRDVLSGGSDPMHLGEGGHIAAPSVENLSWGGGSTKSAHSHARLVSIDTVSRTAIFISDTVSGWYASLARLGEGLVPLAGSRNWHVDVHVKPIGYLGTYRKSRETGLWFTGAHRYHSVGN